MQTGCNRRIVNGSPDWLALITPEQRVTILQLLDTTSRSTEEQANAMLSATPWPSDTTDANERAATVIRYLTRGYRVGGCHPTMGSTELR